ncbi:MAG: hypothetical protein JO061_11510 [Acidobacteriaceae bacterium]|nr:hypothetical protein [Acidobacteriaceae bacterium]
MAEEQYTIETECDRDGRWVAEILDLSELVMACGQTEEEAVANVEALGFRLIAKRIQQTKVGMDRISFRVCSGYVQ